MLISCVGEGGGARARTDQVDLERRAVMSILGFLELTRPRFGVWEGLGPFVAGSVAAFGVGVDSVDEYWRIEESCWARRVALREARQRRQMGRDIFN